MRAAEPVSRLSGESHPAHKILETRGIQQGVGQGAREAQGALCDDAELREYHPPAHRAHQEMRKATSPRTARMMMRFLMRVSARMSVGRLRASQL